MRRSLSFLVLALLMAAWVRNAAGAVAVLPDDGCPSSDAIAANLQRLGALELLSQLGATEVRVKEPSLHLYFRDRQGEALGTRVVMAPAGCEARAALAAAVIATFAGEWSKTELAPPASTAAATGATRAPPKPPWQSELGALFFAVHDGDEGGLGLGMRADLGRGVWLVSALFEGSSEREQPLGSAAGRGGSRFLRAGVGLGVRKQGSRVFWDATLVPMVDRLALAGKDLKTTYTVTSWGFAVAGQTRLGWVVWRLRPFLYLEASYRIPGERMTLEDWPVKVPLSAVNVEAGLGISFQISP
jgi:hypothetical protein